MKINIQEIELEGYPDYFYEPRKSCFIEERTGIKLICSVIDLERDQVSLKTPHLRV